MRERPLRHKPLLLTNDGDLSVFFVGVGSAFSKLHYQNNILIIKGNEHILVDCGTKTPQALHELGLPIADIRTVLVTHSHADHVGGLEEVMLTGRYMTRRKPRIIINSVYQKVLWNMSLRGGSAFNENHDGKNLTFRDMCDPIRPRRLSGFPRETDEINIGDINLKLFRTMHIPAQANSWEDSAWSCGVIIDNRVLFTSDTRYDPVLIKSYFEIFDFDAIFHDCQLFTGGVHAGINELKKLPKKIKRRIHLMHYGDNWKKHTDKISEYGFAGLAKQWHFYDFKA